MQLKFIPKIWLGAAVLTLFTSVSGQVPVSDQKKLKLWYRQPAKSWTEALPIGNGHLGAMVFGGVERELIQLNESSLWSGGPMKDDQNPGAPSLLPKVREALAEKDYARATALAKGMQGLFSAGYLPLGDLLLTQNFNGAQPSAYYRDLNISDAIATTRFTVNGTAFTRQAFASFPDRVIVIRLTAGKPGQLNIDAGTRSILHHQVIPGGKDEFILEGKAPARVDPDYYTVHPRPVVYEDPSGCYGMRFQLRVKVISKGGNTYSDTSGVHVRNATEIILLVSAATSFNGFDKCPDNNGKEEGVLARTYVMKAAAKPWQALLNAHLADFHRYFDRVSLTLDDTSGKHVSLPSDQRLKAYSEGAYDPGLEALYFQYGRYLLISCSRPGGPPANLQGIWNKEMRPPWSSNYTININTQMNYWPAEVTNLSEMHEPLLAFIKNLAVTGRITAKEFYNKQGWVAHHNSDIWAISNPVGDKGWGDPRWASWTQGGNWLCQDLWEHYCFTGDKKYLKDFAYPVMKDAALFCLDWLVEDKDGYLITSPSVSPENAYKDEQGKEAVISVATTMDMAVIWDLFTNLIDASDALGMDKGFRDLLIEKRKKLYPLHIGRLGNLQEWYKDYDDVEVHHRHVSHLFGLYPGRQISPLLTPEFAGAARRTLEIRGDDGTGWSKAWKISFWARLLDGNHAYLLLHQLLHATEEGGLNYETGGGAYPNFFDAHPPFQIDGNFGGTAGMAEMLLQSQSNEIHLLPALPDAWKEGRVRGLKARGGYTVGMHWEDHQLADASIRSLTAGMCTIRTSVRVTIAGVAQKARFTGNGYVLSFKAAAGRTYDLKAAAFISTPSGITIPVDNGRLALQVFSGKIIRVSFTPGASPAEKEELSVIKAPQTTGWKAFRDKGDIVLQTRYINAKIDKEGTVRFYDGKGRLLLAEQAHGRKMKPVTDQGRPTYAPEQDFAVGEEGLYGLGQFQNGLFNWKNAPLRLKQFNQEDGVPFLLSTKGYGLLWDNYSVTDFNPPADELPLTEATDTVLNIRKATFTPSRSGEYHFAVESLNPKENRFRGPVLLTINGDTVIHYSTIWVPEFLSGKAILEAGKKYEVVFQNSNAQSPGKVYYNAPDYNKSIFRSTIGAMTDYYFVYGSTPADIITGYRDLTGAAPMPGKWVLGFWQCRERYHSQGELLENAREYRQRHIPVDMMVQDWNYWPASTWGPEWNRALYPDPAKMVRELTDSNLHLMVSVWPRVANPKLESTYRFTGHTIDKTSGNLDLYNPEVRKSFYRMIKDSMFDIGVSSIWLDGSEPENREPGATAGTGSFDKVALTYPLKVTQSLYEGQRADFPGRRVFNFTRSAFPGMQRYAAGYWTGDVAATWEQFKEQIAGGLNFAMAGMPYWTTDAGGFFRDSLSLNPVYDNQYTNAAYKELLTRWFQFAAFCPLFRIHGYVSNTEVWRYGKAFETTARSYIELRYRLMPYIYSVAGDVTRKGALILSPLVHDYPQDRHTWNITDQFLFGPSILVSPVTGDQSRSRSLYLPEGIWYDFWTGKKRTGGSRVTVDAPLEKIPLMIRAGAIIPAGPALQYAMEPNREPLKLFIYPGKDGHFDLYEDEGENYNYEKGRYSVIPFQWNDRDKTLTIGKRSGSFNGMDKTRRIEIVLAGNERVKGLDCPAIDASIRYDGEQQAVKLKANARSEAVPGPVALYVAPWGNDGNRGSRTHPFKTVTRARDAVRLLNRSMQKDIIVYLRGGTYPIRETIRFNERDRAANGYKIQYRAYNDEVPVISGGMDVTGWENYKGGIFRAKLARTGKLRQLYVNGRRCFMASGPKIGHEDGVRWGQYVIKGNESWADGPGTQPDGVLFREKKNLPLFQHPEDVELHSQSGFAYHIVGLRDILATDSGNVAELQQPMGALAANVNEKWGCGFFHNPLGPPRKFHFENALELLDEPGEFYFDIREGMLYYYKRPGEDMSKAKVTAPLAEGLISIKGRSTADRVSGIDFRGITFAFDHWALVEVAGSRGATTFQSVFFETRYHPGGNWDAAKFSFFRTQQAAIEMQNTDSIGFSGDVFQHLGAMGIDVGNDASHTDITGNVFYDLGSAAINVGDIRNTYIGDGDIPVDKEGVASHTLIRDNYIYQCCREYLAAPVISVTWTEDCAVVHNEITDAPYTGISLGWGWTTFAGFGKYPASTVAKNNRIDSNIIRQTCRLMHDGGAIYTLGLQPGSRIEGNYISGVGGASFCNGIYTDQGTAHLTIKNNVCEKFNGLWYFVWGKDAKVYDIKLIGNYADSVKGNEINNAWESSEKGTHSDWNEQCREITEAAGLQADYKGLPGRIGRQ